MGVFNRSHYEEVLVVRVHPEYLNGQRVPNTDDLPTLWKNRFEAINSWEKHLAESGTTILKFFLNISKAEQKKRFLDRLDTPRKQWKFSAGDVAERKRWDDYMHAYEEALKATSKEWAPWYCIPADDKPFMRLTVATIIEDTISAMNPEYPGVSDEEREKFSAARAELMES